MTERLESVSAAQVEKASADALNTLRRAEGEVQRRKADDDAALITSGLLAVAAAIREQTAILSWQGQGQ